MFEIIVRQRASYFHRFDKFVKEFSVIELTSINGKTKYIFDDNNWDEVTDFYKGMSGDDWNFFHKIIIDDIIAKMLFPYLSMSSKN